MRPYELTSAAEADLREIVRYSIGRWGEEQAERYAKSLEAGFLKIASNKVLSRQFSPSYPQVQVTKCQHHYIFYVLREGNIPHILAVLHERMDLINRLQERLSK